MKGLCIKCLTSNISIFISNGLSKCKGCIDDTTWNNKKEEKKEKEKMLDFEDLPGIDPKNRSLKTYEYLTNKYDEELLLQIKEDKLHED